MQSLFGEECDDGNSLSNDGCSSICKVEIEFCGNDRLERGNGEQCDDGNIITGDGCSNCRIEDGYICNFNQEGFSSICVPTPPIINQYFCGDSLIQWPEQCDDGWPPVSGDGCSSRCMLEVGYNCINYAVGGGYSTFCWRS